MKCKLIAYLLIIWLPLLAAAKDKDKSKQEASYETSGQQSTDLMAAHEQYLVAQIQLNLARQAYADAIAKIRQANGWGADIVFNDQSHKWEKAPTAEPAQPKPAKLEEKKPEAAKLEDKKPEALTTAPLIEEVKPNEKRPDPKQ